MSTLKCRGSCHVSQHLKLLVITQRTLTFVNLPPGRGPRLGRYKAERQRKHGYWLSVTGASMSDVARIRVTVTFALPLLLR